MLTQSDLPVGSNLHPDGAISFPPVGRCIYCGELGYLTKEHIVPFGLSGNMTLPDASCSACQKITSEIERFGLQETFGLWRERHGVKSRNRKKSRRKARRPKEASIEIIDGSNAKPIMLQRSDFPTIISLPHWGTSMLGWNLGMTAPPVKDELVCKFVASDAERLLKVSSGRAFRISASTTNSSVFARFLAKIAYSFAWAVFSGIPVKSDLPRLILTEDPFFRNRIGSEKVRAADGYLWSIGLGIATMKDGARWLGAHIELLTPFDMPRYEILIGKITEDEFKLPPFAHYACSLRINAETPLGAS